MPVDGSAPTSRRLLVLADAEGVAETLCADCSRVGTVRVVHSVDEAVALLNRERFDLFVSGGAELLPLARAFSREEAHAILDNIAQGVCVVDAAGALVWSNSALRAYPPEVSEAVRETCVKLIGELSSDQPGSMRRRTLSAAGLYTFDLTASAIPDGRGGLDRVIGLVCDTTQMARLRDKIDAIDAAGRELVALDVDETARLELPERLRLLEEKLIHYCRELLNFQHFAVLVLDPVSGRLDPVLYAGFPESVRSLRIFAGVEGNGISGYVAATGQSYVSNDLLHEPRYLLGMEGARSSLTVPLRLMDKIVGVLNVEADTPDAFSEEDRQFAEIFSRYIAAALHTLKLLAVERSETTGQVAADVRSELNEPLNDIVVEATRLLQGGLAPEETSRRLHDIVSHVDQVKQRLQEVAEVPAIRGLTRDTTFRDPLLRGKRVLVADDEDIIRETIADVLTKSGALTVMARDGEEAVSLLKTQRFDLVLSDIKMPFRNGYEVFAAAHEANPACPVILITGFGYDPEHSIVRASRDGLAGVLFKPFKVEQLFETIHKALAGGTP